MRKEDLKSTEELLQKRFSGVKSDIYDPGFINFEIKEKKKKKEKSGGFFRSPALQAVGAVLTAVIVGAGTFGALKYLEKRGSEIQGPSQPSDVLPGNGPEDEQPSGNENDKLIFKIDLNKTEGSYVPTADPKQFFAGGDFTIRSEKADGGDPVYGVYAGTAQNEPLFTIVCGAGQPNNALYISNMGQIHDKFVYITRKDGEQRLMCADVKERFAVSEADISAVTENADPSEHRYMSLDLSDDRTTPLLVVRFDSESAVPEETRYITYRLEFEDGALKAAGEYVKPDHPDGGDMKVRVISNGKIVTAKFIGAGSDNTAPTASVRAEAPTLEYDTDLDVIASETDDECTEFYQYSVLTLYDDSLKKMCEGDALYISQALNQRKHSSYLLVATIMRYDNNGAEYPCRYAVNISQWSYETYDINVDAIPDEYDPGAPVNLKIKGATEIMGVPVKLKRIKTPYGEMIEAREPIYLLPSGLMPETAVVRSEAGSFEISYENSEDVILGVMHVSYYTDDSFGGLFYGDVYTVDQLKEAVRELSDKAKEISVTAEFEAISGDGGARTTYYYECEFALWLVDSVNTDDVTGPAADDWIHDVSRTVSLINPATGKDQFIAFYSRKLLSTGETIEPKATRTVEYRDGEGLVFAAADGVKVTASVDFGGEGPAGYGYYFYKLSDLNEYIRSGADKFGQIMVILTAENGVYEEVYRVGIIYPRNGTDEPHYGEELASVLLLKTDVSSDYELVPYSARTDMRTGEIKTPDNDNIRPFDPVIYNRGFDMKLIDNKYLYRAWIEPRDADNNMAGEAIEFPTMKKLCEKIHSLYRDGECKSAVVSVITTVDGLQDQYIFTVYYPEPNGPAMFAVKNGGEYMYPYGVVTGGSQYVNGGWAEFEAVIPDDFESRILSVKYEGVLDLDYADGENVKLTGVYITGENGYVSGLDNVKSFLDGAEKGVYRLNVGFRVYGEKHDGEYETTDYLYCVDIDVI